MYNPVIRGLNAVSKFIGRGFAQVGISGSKVKICKLYTKPFVCQSLSTEPYICQKLSTKNYIDLKVSTQ